MLKVSSGKDILSDLLHIFPNDDLGSIRLGSITIAKEIYAGICCLSFHSSGPGDGDRLADGCKESAANARGNIPNLFLARSRRLWGRWWLAAASLT